MDITAHGRFYQALQSEKPLQIVGVPNALCSKLAKKIGFKAIYLSGASLANTDFGLPDIGLTTLTEIISKIDSIIQAVDLPLLVDLDTGFGHLGLLGRAIESMIRLGVAGVHIEDQVFAHKKCGHLKHKIIVPIPKMLERIQTAVRARNNQALVIMARTDSFELEGLSGLIERAQAYVAAGADMIFAEAIPDLKSYQVLSQAISVPILANLTEFGVTDPQHDWTLKDLHQSGVSMALYPLTANRAMNFAVTKAYTTLKKTGSARTLYPNLQTRKDLYDLLDYKPND